MRRPDYYGFRSQHKRARRRSAWRGSMRLGALFAVLVGINVYVFFFRGGTSIQDILKASAINTSAQGAKGAERHGKGTGSMPALGGETRSDSLVIKGTLVGHLGLSSALAAAKLDTNQINELIAALSPVLDMRSLQPNHAHELHIDPASGRLRKFIYHLSDISAVVATRAPGGEITARKAERKLDIKKVVVGGKVETSLDQAMLKSGESQSIISRFVNLLSWDINWYADPRDGDEYRLIVEKKYLGDKFYGYGRILAAEYKGIIGRRQAFYYKTRGGKSGHYSPEGRSINRSFLRVPLNFRRISSQFDKKRFHPVFHLTKGHFGVDYAADPGTPVWASAAGVVGKAGRYGGAGNMVQLIHPGQINTVYMHFSRIARGIKEGTKVKQRQVIGYVGATGTATGPHLHYGINVNGKPVDPLKFDMGKGPFLPREERMRFLDHLPAMRAELESIPVE